MKHCRDVALLHGSLQMFPVHVSGDGDLIERLASGVYCGGDAMSSFGDL